MSIFIRIADMLLVSGIIFVVWEVVVAARTIAGPDPARIKDILDALSELHFDLERISIQLLNVSGSTRPNPRKQVREIGGNKRTEIGMEKKKGNSESRPQDRS